MNKSVFISYRRTDSGVFVGRLYDRAREYFGPDAVFLDVDSIPYSVDFREHVRSYLKRCRVILVVIGPGWVAASGSSRRIDQADDPVRVEVEEGLRAGRAMIPVYWDDTAPLAAEVLPESIRQLAYLNAAVIDTGRDFGMHWLRLRSAIIHVLFPSLWQRVIYRMSRWIRRNSRSLVLVLTFVALFVLYRNDIGARLIDPTGLRVGAARLDPNVFQAPAESGQQIARVFPDRRSLVNETDLVAAIRGATETFDVLARNASSFYGEPEALRDAIKRGVRFRFILMDHSPANEQFLKAYYQAYLGDLAEYSRNGSEQASLAFEHIRKEMAKISPPVLGGIEVRWLSGPFCNSLWVRDGRAKEGSMAHVEIGYYGDSYLNPSVRVGAVAPAMIESIQGQFDQLWLTKARPR